MKILYVTRHFNRSGYYILEALIDQGFDIVAVTVPAPLEAMDNSLLRPLVLAWYRIKCRFYGCDPCRFTGSEVLLARRSGIPVIAVEDINADGFYRRLQVLNPDIIVIGGGHPQLLSPRVFNFPKMGALNTHPSLLPQFRGTAVHRWQIMHGVKRSGVTIHLVDSKFDRGKILAKEAVDVSIDDTPQALFEKTALAGADLMPRLLRAMQYPSKDDRTVGICQKQAEVHYFNRWQWSEERLTIDWSISLWEIHNLIRACHQDSYEFSGPVALFAGKPYFVRRARWRGGISTPSRENGRCTVIDGADSEGLHVKQGTQPGKLVITRIQPYWGWWRLSRSFNPHRLVRSGQLSVGDSLV